MDKTYLDLTQIPVVVSLVDSTLHRRSGCSVVNIEWKHLHLDLVGWRFRRPPPKHWRTLQHSHRLSGTFPNKLLTSMEADWRWRIANSADGTERNRDPMEWNDDSQSNARLGIRRKIHSERGNSEALWKMQNGRQNEERPGEQPMAHGTPIQLTF